MGIIATGWIEGLSSEVVYLTRAIFSLRSIPRDTIKAARSNKIPSEVSDQYLRAVTRYHKEYVARLRRDLAETIWVEAEELAKHILDFDAYDVIQALRAGPHLAEELQVLLETDKTALRKQLSSLEKGNIILRLNDEKGREHILLQCDPEVVTVYPEWLIERTIDLYNGEEIVSRQAIHYLEVLKRSHPSYIGMALTEVE
jgi:hypothetical protein